MMEPKIRFKGFDGEWKASTIGDFCSVSIGEFVIKTKQNDNAPYPVYNGGSSYTGFYENYNQEGPKVIVSARGANAGFVNYCEKNFWAGNSCYSIATKDNRNLKFLYHCLKKNQSNYLNNQQAANIPSISKKDIQETILVMPKSFEQQAIASYFTSLDSQISASTSRLTSLKQMKAASLQTMFPQEGETVPKIRFKGFEGEWKTCPLSSIATMHARIGWQNLRKDEFMSNGDYYLITGTDFNDGKISFETCHYIDKERYDQDKNIQLEIDSILITKDGTLGKVAFVDSLDKPATLNAGVFNVRPKDKEIYPKYLFQYLKAPYLMDYVDKNATGGTIKHLNQNMLVNFPVQHPSYKEQEKIGDYLFNLDHQITLQTQRLEKLKQIKSACLDKMFV